MFDGINQLGLCNSQPTVRMHVIAYRATAVQHVLSSSLDKQDVATGVLCRGAGSDSTGSAASRLSRAGNHTHGLSVAVKLQRGQLVPPSRHTASSGQCP